jgi:hypothetical protein
MLLAASAQANALTPFETVTDWICAAPQERVVAVRILTLIAGQGYRHTDESFFVHCLDESAQAWTLLNKKIGEVAAGCVMMDGLTFAEQD